MTPRRDCVLLAEKDVVARERGAGAFLGPKEQNKREKNRTTKGVLLNKNFYSATCHVYFSAVSANIISFRTILIF